MTVYAYSKLGRQRVCSGKGELVHGIANFHELYVGASQYITIFYQLKTAEKMITTF